MRLHIVLCSLDCPVHVILNNFSSSPSFLRCGWMQCHTPWASLFSMRIVRLPVFVELTRMRSRFVWYSIWFLVMFNNSCGLQPVESHSPAQAN